MRKAKLFLCIVFLGAMVLLGYRLVFVSPLHLLEHLSSYVLYPVLVIHHKLVDPVKIWLQKKYTMQDLKAKLQLLQEEKEQLLAENITLHTSLSYLHATRELREFKQRYNYDTAQIAQVLVRHFSDQAHFFLIDKGSSHGIEPDMVVIHNNCLIGKVAAAYPWYSKVCLITDRLCKVAAYCSRTKANGIHEGINKDDHTALCYVSHLAHVDEGDLVISSGEGMVFPQGFALGRIVAKKQDGFHHQIHVEPLADLRNIRYCLIMPKSAATAGATA